MQRNLIMSRLKSKICSGFSDWNHRFWNSLCNLETSRDSDDVDAIELEPRTPFAPLGSIAPQAASVTRQTLDFAASMGFSQSPPSALETLSTSELTIPAPKSSSSYLHGSLQDLAENIARAKRMVLELNVQLNAMKKSFDAHVSLEDSPGPPESGQPPNEATPSPTQSGSDSRPPVPATRLKPVHRASREPTIRSCRFQKFCSPRNPRPKFRTKRLSIARSIDWTT